MVLTDNEELAEKCRYFKNLCFPLKGPREYRHDHIGFNYRMSNLHAALGLAQVEQIDRYVEARRKNNRLYREFLHDIPGISLQPEKVWAKNVFWMNGILVDRDQFGMGRDDLMRQLKERSVDTRSFFSGMHKQHSLSEYGCAVSGLYPVTERLAAEGLYLPSGSGLTEYQIKFVCDSIKSLFRKR